MIGREYEEFLQKNAITKQPCFDFCFWLSVTGIGFVIPLIGFLIQG